MPTSRATRRPDDGWKRPREPIHISANASTNASTQYVPRRGGTPPNEHLRIIPDAFHKAWRAASSPSATPKGHWFAQPTWNVIRHRATVRSAHTRTTRTLAHAAVTTAFTHWGACHRPEHGPPTDAKQDAAHTFAIRVVLAVWLRCLAKPIVRVIRGDRHKHLTTLTDTARRATHSADAHTLVKTLDMFSAVLSATRRGPKDRAGHSPEK